MTTVGRKRQIHGDSEKVSVWREGGRGRKKEKAELEESLESETHDRYFNRRYILIHRP